VSTAREEVLMKVERGMEKRGMEERGTERGMREGGSMRCSRWRAVAGLIGCELRGSQREMVFGTNQPLRPDESGGRFTNDSTTA